ncbi:MAG: YfiR family protein [Pseudomonadota bacterium]
MATARYIQIRLWLASLALLAWPLCATAVDIEHQIKAAYLYKFASYVDWPASALTLADAPVTIGVLGADEIATELNNINSGRPANSRPIEVKRLKPGEPLTGIQMLFIGREESARLKRLQDSLQSRPVLTVTDSAGALGNGSVINFVTVDDRIRFEVSVAQAEQSGLKISARLLGVAQKIETRKQ